MAPSRPSHRFFCLGVPGKSDLGFPATNAEAIFSMLTGALGPPAARAVCLTGEGATKGAVVAELEAATEGPVRFYMMYFSGAANAKGLRLSDGYLDGGIVERHFDRINASAVLLVLEVSSGPRLDSDVIPKWVEAMAEARPGFRLAATRATRIGAGSEGAGRGRFAAALLAALDRAEGDLDFEGESYISDRRALEEARAELLRRFGVTHMPEQVGLFGDFPLARCQTKAQVGSGRIVGFAVGKGVSGIVRFATEERRGVPTRLHYELLDATDERLAEDELRVVPSVDHVVSSQRIRLSPDALAAHTVWGATLEVGGTVFVQFRISLLDSAGRAHDVKVYGHEYDALPRGSRSP